MRPLPEISTQERAITLTTLSLMWDGFANDDEDETASFKSPT